MMTYYKYMYNSTAKLIHTNFMKKITTYSV